MADRALSAVSEAWPHPADVMEQWIVAIFLDDGTNLWEMTVDAGSRVDAVTRAVHEAGRNGIDGARIHHTSAELADESRHVYTGGWCDASDSFGCMTP